MPVNIEMSIWLCVGITECEKVVELMTSTTHHMLQHIYNVSGQLCHKDDTVFILMSIKPKQIEYVVVVLARQKKQAFS